MPAPADTLAFHRALPGYETTPLVRATDLANELGLDDVFVKDESSRFGLPAFKFLGASWAVAQLLGGSSDLDELRAAAARQGVRRLTTATAGNHGRAVARMAALLGLDSTIYMSSSTAQARRDAVAGEGAEVVIVAGGIRRRRRCVDRRRGRRPWRRWPSTTPTRMPRPRWASG